MDKAIKSNFKPDVFLRGQRDYVQGTQLIAQAAKCLAAPDKLVFEQGTFSTITRNDVIFSLERGESSIGSVQFKGQDHRITLFVQEDKSIARREDTPLSLELIKTEPTEADAVVYKYTADKDFLGILDVIVQSIKAEHVAQFETAYDIWFTGLRRCNLPVSVKTAGQGSVTLKLMRKMGAIDNSQTLWSVELEDTDGTQLSCNVTFVFKSK